MASNFEAHVNESLLTSVSAGVGTRLLESIDSKPVLSDKTFSDAALKVLHRGDTSHDKQLDRKELETELRENKFGSPAERDAAQAMLDHFDVVDMFGSWHDGTNAGISEIDIRTFDSLRDGKASFLLHYVREDFLGGAMGGGIVGMYAGVITAPLAAEIVGTTSAAVLTGGATIAIPALAIGGVAAYNSWNHYKKDYVPKVTSFLHDINADQRVIDRL